MRSQIILTSLCATLAIANPLVKKGIVYDYETDIVVVTVTEGEAAPTPAPEPVIVTITQDAAAVQSQQAKEVVQPAAQSVAAPAESVYSSAASPAAPSQASSGSSSSGDSGVQGKAIDGHNSNERRPAHKASQLTWNDTLADYASGETSCSKFAHITNHEGYGQNIYAAFSTDENGFTDESAMEGAANDWWNEISLFNVYGQANPPVNDAWTHYSQMTWCASETIGCAVQKCGTDNTIQPGWYVWYVTCDYYPVGNVLGEFDKNVLQ